MAAPIEWDVFQIADFVANSLGGTQCASRRLQGGKPQPWNMLLKTKRMILFSVIELLVLGGMIYLLIFHTELWRSVFVLAFCPVVFVLALNEGLISRFLGIKPFNWISKIQLEFYILHLAMIRLFFNLDFIGFDSKWIQGLTMLIIVIIAATAYHVLLTDRLAVHMKSLFSRLIDKKSFN